MMSKLDECLNRMLGVKTLLEYVEGIMGGNEVDIGKTGHP